MSMITPVCQLSSFVADGLLADEDIHRNVDKFKGISWAYAYLLLHFFLEDSVCRRLVTVLKLGPGVVHSTAQPSLKETTSDGAMSIKLLHITNLQPDLEQLANYSTAQWQTYYTGEAGLVLAYQVLYPESITADNTSHPANARVLQD